MTHDILIAGFGGQGILSMGQLLALAGMLEGKQVSWIPSYGPEMRGGTANCAIIISDEPIGSPLLAHPGTVVAMNLPSLEKFEPLIKSGGTLIVNSSLVDRDVKRKDITVHKIPSDEIARELGNAKTSNMVTIGAVVSATGAVKIQSVIEAFTDKFDSKPELIAINKEAIRRGAVHLAMPEKKI